ncbi:MAG: tRNA (N(6)-L-threonylcarbamoyladenosine(37)-C(2))-methylthiotransferase MtaB [Myxococcota bacterium]
MEVYLDTLGCRLNEAELASWRRQFIDAGHAVLPRPDRAHVIVFNTCAVTAEAARKSRQRVRRLHRANPQAHLVVTGCYAALEPDKVADLMGVDLVISNQDKPQLVQTILDRVEPTTMPSLAAAPDSSHMYRKTRNRAFVKIQDGCKNRCTFCVVTIARGNERSRSPETILHEINQLHAEGTEEVVLTGVHLGGYGRDRNTTLAELMALVLAETDIPRLRLGSLEPWDLPDHIWSLWANPRLCPHLHLPLQSGSDTVLKRMARRCPTARYQALVEAARSTIPKLNITTDLIVGFPGESEEEWSETQAFVQRVGFGHMHIFTYSPRQGTTAARMKGHLPNTIKRARSRQLHTIAARMKRDTLQRHIGTQAQVLWEGRGEPTDDPNQRRWNGYTEHYLRVEALVPTDRDLENSITPTLLTDATDDTLLGTLVLPQTVSADMA